MKKYILLFAATAFILTACKSKNADDHGHDNAHQHEDGTLHEHENETPPTQEEFIVDTVKQNNVQKEEDQHQHDNGEKHTHD
jgi:hypothetical protein